jgi:uncharacterized protein (DUF1499 family)
VALAAGPAGIHLGLLRPLAGFIVCMAGLVLGGLLALGLGVAGLWSTRASAGRAGRGRAALGAGIGAALIALLGSQLADSAKAPRIHDITTDVADPPAFSAAARHPDNAGRTLGYPDGPPETPELQREAYPELKPIHLDRPPAEALALARRAAERLGWIVTAEDAGAGLLEAEDTTRLFRFVDDIVVRVRPREAGSVVDVRSTSRVGRGDLGANARRIRAFAQALRAGP